MQDWFDTLYHSKYKFLYIYALRLANGNNMLIQEIPDILQRAFLVLYKNYNVLVYHPNIEAWLTVTVRHILSETMKKQRTHNINVEYSINDVASQQKWSMAEANSVNQLDAACMQINDKLDKIEEVIGENNMLLLSQYYGNEINHEQLANRLGVSETALRKKVSRLRAQIRASLTALTILLFAMSQIR